MLDEARDLQDLANRIRRDPRLAQEMDVSLLVEQVVGRWRQYNDLIEASEEVPVAAWIVRRKIEGLVRPESPEPQGVAFDPEQRASWTAQAVALLHSQASAAGHFLPRAVQLSSQRRPAPVKDASVWKLTWSFPRLRPAKKASVAVVETRTAPLHKHMQSLLQRLRQKPRLVFQEELAALPRQQWPVYFLAAVHLWHEQSVHLSQVEAFGRLVVEQAGD